MSTSAAASATASPIVTCPEPEPSGGNYTITTLASDVLHEAEKTLDAARGRRFEITRVTELELHVLTEATRSLRQARDIILRTTERLGQEKMGAPSASPTAPIVAAQELERKGAEAAPSASSAASVNEFQKSRIAKLFRSVLDLHLMGNQISIGFVNLDEGGATANAAANVANYAKSSEGGSRIINRYGRKLCDYSCALHPDDLQALSKESPRSYLIYLFQDWGKIAHYVVFFTDTNQKIQYFPILKNQVKGLFAATGHYATRYGVRNSGEVVDIAGGKYCEYTSLKALIDANPFLTRRLNAD